MTSPTTRAEVLWRVDCLISWEAPDCALPAPLQGPELNLIVGRGAYKVDQPRHCLRIGFEINAPDEATALGHAQAELDRDLHVMADRHAASGAMPVIDLHLDRIVLDRLAVREVLAPSAAEPMPNR